MGPLAFFVQLVVLLSPDSNRPCEPERPAVDCADRPSGQCCAAETRACRLCRAEAERDLALWRAACEVETLE